MQKWYIYGEEFAEAWKVAEYITDNLDDSIFADMLDECYPEVEICGLSYFPSVAFSQIDPIAYRCSMLDYYSDLSSDLEYEIDRMSDGEELEFYGISVRCEEEEEEED